MLNNNAELDNGVYNDADDDEKKKDEDDGLMGLNQQIQSEPTIDDDKEDQIRARDKSPNTGGGGSNPASYLASLNTS